MVVPPALMTFEIMTIVKGSGAQDKRAVFCSGGHVTTGTQYPQQQFWKVHLFVLGTT